MKKFSKKTGKIMGLASLIMICLAVAFVFFMFSSWGWRFDNAVFAPFMQMLHIPYTAWFWFLWCYILLAILLAVLAGYFSEKS